MSYGKSLKICKFFGVHFQLYTSNLLLLTLFIRNTNIKIKIYFEGTASYLYADKNLNSIYQKIIDKYTNFKILIKVKDDKTYLIINKTNRS